MTKSVLEACAARGHEQVVFFNYPDVGLKAIVAIHDTTLGPALGGCRMSLYQNDEHALDDVMRLSEGMTYKSALAGLPLGGGKSIIIADPTIMEGREALLQKFGECLNALSGRYITAEDMGTSVRDIMAIRAKSKYVVGTDPAKGGTGDPHHGPRRAYSLLCELLLSTHPQGREALRENGSPFRVSDM